MLPETFSLELAQEHTSITRAIATTLSDEHQKRPAAEWQVRRIVRIMTQALGNNRDLRLCVLRMFFEYGHEGNYVTSTKNLTWAQAMALILRLLDIGRFETIPNTDPPERVMRWLKCLAGQTEKDNANG